MIFIIIKVLKVVDLICLIINVIGPYSAFFILQGPAIQIHI